MTWKTFLILIGLVAGAGCVIGFLCPAPDRADILRVHGVVETQEIRLGSKLGGRVAAVDVAEGTLVEPGQALVRFETPELEAQYQQQEARVHLAEAELAKALHGYRSEEIRQAQSDWESAEADYKHAVQDFSRADRLFREGTSSRADYDTATAARDRSAARLRAAAAKFDLVKAGTRSEEIDEARARVAEQRGRLRELEVNLREAVIRAPSRGVVEIVSVRKGDLVPANQTVVRMLRAEDLWIKVYVPETDLGKVFIGQVASVTIDAYPGRTFEGTVYQIASESEFSPRNIQSLDERSHQVFGVRVRVQQPAEPSKQVFKSGMAAEVELQLKETARAGH